MSLASAALDRWQQLAPDNPVLGALSIHVDLRSGKLAPALAQAQRLLKQPKGWQAILPPLADTQIDHGATARLLIRSLLEHDQLPAEINAWLAFAGLARRLNDPALSQDIETKLIERFPIIVYLGAGAIAWTAGRMIAHDPLLGRLFDDRPWAGYALDELLIVAICGGGWLAQRRQEPSGGTPPG